MGISATPIIRWAGSKRKYVQAILKFITIEPKRYLEPFCGSAAVFFSASPRTAILADVNSSLIDFYNQVRRSPQDIYDVLVNIPRHADNYYEIRQGFHSIGDPITKAAHFYYLNRNCFNGLFRTSKDGHFNVPYSNKRTGRYPTKEMFIASVSPLNNADIVCSDFERVVMDYCKAGDIVYLDPPYSGAGRYPFREYFPGCFSVKDFDRLRTVLLHIDRIGARFVLTFSPDYARR